ncbi:Hypothetical protein A7982_03718 [Minicystis rosea]|nr:Hypothetical protein A7982_03718 [Minicystis rosea]
MLVDGTHAFYIWYSGNAENLMRVPVAGGAPTKLFDTAPLAPLNFNGWSMVQSASHIYTAVDDLDLQSSTIYAVPKAGGAAVKKATAAPADNYSVRSMASNATHVFWSNGNLERVAK